MQRMAGGDVMVRILHTADFHLDSAFGALGEEQARQRRQECRKLMDRLVDAEGRVVPDAEIRLCADQLKRHMTAVFLRYRRCPRGPMRKEIIRTAENTFRLIRKEGKHLPLSCRLLCRFSTGYAAWLARRALKNRLRRRPSPRCDRPS